MAVHVRRIGGIGARSRARLVGDVCVASVGRVGGRDRWWNTQIGGWFGWASWCWLLTCCAACIARMVVVRFVGCRVVRVVVRGLLRGCRRDVSLVCEVCP